MSKTPKSKSKSQGDGTVASDKSEIVRQLPAACSDELTAVEFMERQRWGSTPACPRCGDTEVAQVKGSDGQRSKRFLWRCYGCKQQFTVRIGTILEDSRIPLRHWAYAFWAACAGKKGVSALQIQRQTGLSYKSALFLMHRIRHAMTDTSPTPRKLTGIVEADETYIGGRHRRLTRGEWIKRRADMKARGLYRLPQPPDNKIPVVAIIQRGGDVRAAVVPHVTQRAVQDLLLKHVHPSATLMTDEAALYTRVGRPFRSHQTVAHTRKEYARGKAHSNSAESFFARLKRQLHGTHHSVSKKHLHRYVSEAAFKHNTRYLEDGQRVVAAICGAEGKHLKYRDQVSA